MNRIVATSDQDTFQRVLDRLSHEVGTFIKLIPKGIGKGFNFDWAPLWALVRMTFPVAESLGDLIHRQHSTSNNLKLVLENQFNEARPGYDGKAATLAQLFRHSLTHTDELRVLVTPNGERVGWRLSCFEPATHLNVETPKPGASQVCFDATAFYEDMVEVCRRAMGKSWGGNVMTRYNSWLTYPLDASKPSEKAVVAELGRGFKPAK
jgi:hypothetical protein